jgi:hypothetical protein
MDAGLLGKVDLPPAPGAAQLPDSLARCRADVPCHASIMELAFALYLAHTLFCGRKVVNMPKRRKIPFALLAFLLFTFSSLEFASAQCAVKPTKPIPPIGCKDVTPQCVTTSNGQSYWTWICVPQGGGAEANPVRARQVPAPEQSIPRAADQITVHAAPVNPVEVAPQTHVPISEDSEPAVETLRTIAQRIGECPKVLDFESQWGRKKDEIEQFYQEPPVNLVWDVVAGSSVRARYMGYVEFTVTEDDWVPESAERRFWKITLADPLKLAVHNQIVGPWHYRYEYDLGPDGLQLTRALKRNRTTGEWVEATGDSLAKYCWNTAARDSQANANALRDQSVPQVSAHAAAPVRNAAEQSDAEAEYNLGVAYDNGKGVPQDNAQAAAWFRKAAEQGFAEAQYELGLLYAKGQGVPQDYAQAVLWTRKAAEQGDAEAQLFVGLQYAIGQGVSQDYAEAYFWLDVAVAGKLDSADAKDGAKIRDEIVFHLPPADQARVQERVRKWFEDHPAKPQ